MNTVIMGVPRDHCIPHYCRCCSDDIYVLQHQWPPGKLDDVTFLCTRCVCHYPDHCE